VVIELEARDLEYFIVVAGHGNLRRAADALGLSQPALSKSLRRLEKSAGTKLVKRTPKGVELTAVGSALLGHARRLRLSFDDIEREIRDLVQGRAGHLRIGAAAATVEHPVSPACTALLKDAPKLTLQITIGANDVLLPALRSGKLDLIVSGVPAVSFDDLVHERMYDDEFVIYASANHRLAGRKRLTVSDLAGERFALASSGGLATQNLRRIFEEGGIRLPVATMESPVALTKFHLVASSDVLGFASRRELHEGARRFRLVELSVKGLPWIRTVGASYRKDAYLSPATHRLIDLLKSTAREIPYVKKSEQVKGARGQARNRKKVAKLELRKVEPGPLTV
jgi:DNA-binding transcriptional LysR family regulator